MFSKPLNRKNTGNYKNDFAYFDGKTTIGHIHELLGSVEAQTDKELEIRINTPEYLNKNYYTITHNGKPFSIDDEKRTEYYGHDEENGESNLKGASENGSGTRITLAYLSEVVTEESIRNKTFKIDDSNFHKFCHLLYDVNGEWTDYTCYRTDREGMRFEKSSDLTNKCKNIIETFSESTTVCFLFKKHLEYLNVDTPMTKKQKKSEADEKKKEESKFKWKMRAFLNQSAHIYLNDESITDMNKGKFLDPIWGDPYIQIKISVYKYNGSGTSYVGIIEKITHQNIYNSCNEFPEKIYIDLSYRTIKVLQETLYIEDIFIEPFDENDEKYTLLYKSKATGQNSSTRDGSDKRTDYYEKELCKSPCIHLRKNGLLYNYGRETPVSNYLQCEKGNGIAHIIRDKGRGYGNDRYKNKDSKFYDNQQLQWEIEESRKFIDSAFNKPANKEKTTTLKRGSNESTRCLTQIPHLLRMISMQYLWSKEKNLETLAKLIHQKWKIYSWNKIVRNCILWKPVVDKIIADTKAEVAVNTINKKDEELERLRLKAKWNEVMSDLKAIEVQRLADLKVIQLKKEKDDAEKKADEKNIEVDSQNETINELKHQLKEAQTEKYSSTNNPTLLSRNYNVQYGSPMIKCIICEGMYDIFKNRHNCHILADKEGGEISFENTILGCQSCNSNMKHIHLLDYVMIRWPHRVESVKQQLINLGKKVD